MVIWAFILPGNRQARLEAMVVLDILLGLTAERILTRSIHRLDTEPYHAPGPLAKSRRLRRALLTYMICFLLRTMWVAVTDVAGTGPVAKGTGKYEYYCTILALPAAYTMARTLLLDAIHPDSHDHVEEMEGVTNSFTISDETDAEDEMEVDLGQLDLHETQAL